MKMDHSSLDSKLIDHLNAPSSFIDYARFEDSNTARKTALNDFVNGEVYTPDYRYPKLTHPYDTDDKGSSISEKKSKTYEAILELEAHKYTGYLPESVFELYASYHEARLKKMMLVEAAKRLHEPGTSSQLMVAREEYSFLNKELYGEMNVEAFSAIMATESRRVEEFIPSNGPAAQIKSELLDYFRQYKFSGVEKCHLSDEEMSRMKESIDKRYAHCLEPIPDTQDDVYYDAQECVAIMNSCLLASGLAKAGWICEVNPTKANPATNEGAKKIFLPATTRRNAAELRRLYLHEGEVHARRAYNGSLTDIVPLEKGTANYADVEEGLGVVLEAIDSGDMTSSAAYNRARDRYILAGLALGTDGHPKDGRSSYEIMWRLVALRGSKDGTITEQDIISAKQQATAHSDNAFRGTNFAMPGVIYSKLKVYYEGLAKNVTYLRDHIDTLDEALDIAMTGKYDHTDQHERSHVQNLVM